METVVCLRILYGKEMILQFPSFNKNRSFQGNVCLKENSGKCGTDIL